MGGCQGGSGPERSLLEQPPERCFVSPIECADLEASPLPRLLHNLRIPLADTLTLMFLNPPICALLGWALLGERASWRTAAGCVLLVDTL